MFIFVLKKKNGFSVMTENKDNKICLDIEQMNHLSDLGLDVSNASMCYCKVEEDAEEDDYLLAFKELVHKKGGLLYYYDSFTKKDYLLSAVIYSYTLQDIFGILPKDIRIESIDRQCYLFVDLSDGFIGYYYVSQLMSDKWYHFEAVMNDENMLDAAYYLLCWCIEQGLIAVK